MADVKSSISSAIKKLEKIRFDLGKVKNEKKHSSIFAESNATQTSLQELSQVLEEVHQKAKTCDVEFFAKALNTLQSNISVFNKLRRFLISGLEKEAPCFIYFLLSKRLIRDEEVSASFAEPMYEAGEIYSHGYSIPSHPYFEFFIKHTPTNDDGSFDWDKAYSYADKMISDTSNNTDGEWITLEKQDVKVMIIYMPKNSSIMEYIENIEDEDIDFIFENVRDDAKSQIEDFEKEAKISMAIIRDNLKAITGIDHKQDEEVTASTTEDDQLEDEDIKDTNKRILKQEDTYNKFKILNGLSYKSWTDEVITYMVI